MTDYKALGNAALQQKNFSQAIEFYTKGIEQEPTNYLLYSNRSAAYLSSGAFAEAAEDSKKSIELNKSWVKGYVRLAQALVALNKFQEAREYVIDGLKLEPQNQILQGLLQQIMNNDEDMSGSFDIFSKLQDPALMDKIKQSPVLRNFLDDPTFVEMIQDLQSNPTNIGQYREDFRLLYVLKECCGLKIDIPSQEDARKREHEEFERQRQERKRKEEEEIQRKKSEEEAKNALPENQEKAKGNAAYLKKDFETALTHYNNAIEINPKEISFRLNKASVFIETGRTDEAIKVCEEALEIGRENKASFEEMGKIYAKIGNAYLRVNEYEKAIEAYKSSILEHKNRQTVLQLKKAQELLEKKQKEEYHNPEIGAAARDRGTELFKQQKFPEAKKEYDEAIKRNPKDHLSYSNRAATYMKLGAYQYALKDLDECLAIDPSFVKAYSRKGQCHVICKEYHKALKAFDDGLKVDPKNSDLLTRRQQLLQLINSSESPEEKARRRDAALSDPEIKGILSDPQFQHVLNQLSSDPRAAATLMKDPQIRERVEKLVAAGVLEIA